MFTEEASGVFGVASRFVDGKNGIVVGERAALAIDCSNYEDEGQAMADFIRDKGFAPDRLVLTHGHGDHIWGGKPLKSGDVFAHHLTPGVMERQVPQALKRREVSEEVIRSEMPWPTVTYRDELQIDLGGKTVWMFPSPGHSVDGVSVYVVEDKLLFSGDSVVTGIVAAIGDGDSRILEQSLHKLMKMDIETLVPGHGETLHSKARVQDWLQWQAGYLASVRNRLQDELAAGKDAEAAAEAVDFETYIGDRLPIDRNGMPKRHRNTVDKIVEELATDNE
ncbi:MAG: MBL fold metallo-hydrolase [Candidatus Latescibacteria bacterium]|jgi:cyclase|nr:MBL fold metallo-hydrolase [Candidatus Latescibacterota bacterium]MBT5832265.1 MBL fold metallo-hydrolase [Candidatus Latescibacterota bacterium]